MWNKVLRQNGLNFRRGHLANDIITRKLSSISAQRRPNELNAQNQFLEMISNLKTLSL
jgi:hypothetical protein